MLKSKLIDTKYVDPKGVTRTPNVITSITEDEIKEGKFSPEDILPATAVQVALSNTKVQQLFALQSDGIWYNTSNAVTLIDGDFIVSGTKIQVNNRIAFNNEIVSRTGILFTPKIGTNQCALDESNLYMFSYNRGQEKTTSISSGNITLEGSTGSVSINPDATDTQINTKMVSGVWKVLNGANTTIADLSSDASLSDLISSYNNLLAHLRTIGLLKSN